MPHTEPVLPIGVPIAPTQPEDTNPTHIAEYGRGGLMSVATTTVRDAIPSGRKKVGMLVFVQADSKYYTLTSTPNTWTEFVGSGTSPTADIATASTQDQILAEVESLSANLTGGVYGGTWVNH
jgi:hypothetical protein